MPARAGLPSLLPDRSHNGWHAWLQALSAVSSLLPGGAGAAADAGRHTQQALELAAQLQYRLGRSKECIQLYDTLFQQHKVKGGAAWVYAWQCSAVRVARAVAMGSRLCTLVPAHVHHAALQLFNRGVRPVPV